MFILDFFLGGLMDQFIDWIYSQLVGFFGNFFAEMGNMGVELFEMSWVSDRPGQRQGCGPQCHQGFFGRWVLYPGAGGTL